MGFDLKPKRKEAGYFHMGAFSWHWMLEAGAGWPLGYFPGIEPGQFIFSSRKDGLCIGYNDGARVNATEAKAMADMVDMICNYQTSLRGHWERHTETERKEMEEGRARIYNVPVRADFIEKAKAFAEWARKSGGFRVF